MVGEGGFEPPTPWSRTWGDRADFVATQSFEWCFNRLILARSRHSGMNVSPPMAVPLDPLPPWQGPVQRRLARLLHASFRPRLTATPLRFAITSPSSGCEEDSHLQAIEHARRTNRHRGSGHPLSPATPPYMRVRIRRFGGLS